MVIKRKEIWLIDFNTVRGSEQKGVRPGIIVSNDIANQYGNTVTVVPLTSRVEKARLPTHVVIPKEESSLRLDSLALCEHIRTVDKERLIKRIGEVRGNLFISIEEGIKVHLDFIL